MSENNVPEGPSKSDLPEISSGSPCLQGERVSFTGTLASMPHRQAHEIVEKNGGTATANVSGQSTMLVVGEEGWPLESDGHPSQKLQQAAQLQQQGYGLKIVNESDWLHLVGLDERRQEIHRLYTPAMLSQLLDVPVSLIRQWERAGLIQAVRSVHRLPYFDFQEVTSARKLSELLSSGASRKKIEKSLERLVSILGEIDRPLSQLNLLVRDSRLLCRDEAGLLEPLSGQRVLDFDPPKSSDEDETAGESTSTVSLDSNGQIDADGQEGQQQDWSPDDWFEQGCRLLEENNPESAVEAFRLCLMDDAGNPEVHFYLAETLYRLGNTSGAVERYYMAVELDHQYIEAWTQLGCLFVELGKHQRALEAFDIGLTLHPEYPDAHLHKADVLHQMGRTEEAVVHWQKYLEWDNRGPWAENARQRLKEAGGASPVD